MEERFVQVADLRHPRRDGAEVEVPRIEQRRGCGLDVEEDVVGALRLVAAGRPGRGA